MFKKIFLIIIIVLVSSWVTLLLKNNNNTPKDVYILEKPYGNISYLSALQKIQSDFSVPTSIQLKSKKTDIQISTNSFYLNLDADATLKQIRDDQSSQGFFAKLISYLPIQSKIKIYKPIFTYDKYILQEKLKEISQTQNSPFVPTEFNLANGKIQVKTGQLGQTADIDKFQTLFETSLANYSLNQSFELNFLENGQLPSEDQLARSLELANKLISKKLILKVNDRQEDLSDSVIISWINPLESFDLEKISSYATELSKSFSRDPVNAVMQIDDGKVIEFIPSRDGIGFDIPQLTAFIKNNIEQLQQNPDQTLVVDLPYLATPPSITNENINNLGIKELLGQGKSTFHHSSAIRNHNVQNGARLVNRILVPPGEEFSFTKNLGAVDASTGFKEAYVIKASGTELEYGGGVCQVSTTMFRAMLNAGLNITSRKNHSYRVSYYEEDMPPGYDATVYVPNPDLKFLNDTPAHILIQNYYDDKNKTLTYEIWGTSDGRKAEISNYRQWGAAPAPPARYIDDPTLPSGKLIKTETAVPGLKTSFDWKVTRNNQELYSKTFVSNFVPWAAVYRRGTKI